MNDLFLRACRRLEVERTPVWLMRQAGRYLPEYREVRSNVDFRTLCFTPDLAVKVTLQPLDRFELDAAIVFADIMTPLTALGIDIDFAPGPVVAHPIRSAAAVDALRIPEAEEIAPETVEAVGILSRELAQRVPLIGFAGAPLTLAAYLVEGKGSKDFNRLRSFLLAEPKAAKRLFDLLATAMGRYLRAQVEAGAQAVQLFESWAGILSRKAYEEFALPAVIKVFRELDGLDVPRILFAQSGSSLAPLFARTGAEVIGVDWRVPISEVEEQLGSGFAYQGNLDPAVLRTPKSIVEKEVREVLAGAPAKGHIFNLGHGILPDTPIESVHAVLDEVRRVSCESNR